MKVKLNTGRAGRGFTQRPGDVVEVSQSEGEALIRLRQAELVSAELVNATVETASAEPARNASKRPKRM